MIAPAVLAFLAACAGDSADAPPPLPVAAESATFTTVTGLGSFHLTASVRRTDGPATAKAPAATSLETMDLRWKDADHWSLVRSRDGSVKSAVTVWDAVAWSGNAERALEEKGDAEPYRVQVGSVWDPWAWGLEGLASMIAVTPTGVELLDGRRAVRHTVAPTPAPAKPRRGWTVTAATGEVWIDEAAAVRLRGEVHVSAISGDRTRDVELLFSLDDLGLDPGVSPPGRDKP